MTNHKKQILLFGTLCFVFAIFSINFMATQYLANSLSSSVNLGEPLISGFYSPLKWISWSSLYYVFFSSFFITFFLYVAIAFLVAFISFGFVIFYVSRSPQAKTDLYGSAHWASEEEVKKSGLFDQDEGVYVGAWKDKNGEVHYLRHNGPEHVIYFAPTRSGKGVGLVIPTLLSWPHSVLVFDIKGENYAITSAWRSQHANNLIFKFDPANDEDSARFNPLDEIRLGTNHEVADVQNIVTMIVDPEGKGLNDHWAKTGHALLVGAILHLLYKAKQKSFKPTLKGVSELLSDPERTIESVFNEMLEFHHKDGKPHPVVAASARDMLNKADNERSGVLSTAMSFLSLYRDPIVAKNTSESDFCIRDLMNHEKPVSLYIVAGPDNIDRLKPLIRLLLNQIMRTLTSKMEFKNGRTVKHYKHRLLLLIDEFSSLGKLEIFQQSLAFIAGYGLKAYLIVQDLVQLYDAYGKNESIISNCHIRGAYAPNKPETAELASKMLGTSTVVKKSVSNSGKRFSTLLGNVSESLQEVSRPLLTPDECMRLPGATKDSNGDVIDAGDMLIFVAGQAPIYGKQILFFKDPVFVERANTEDDT